MNNDFSKEITPDRAPELCLVTDEQITKFQGLYRTRFGHEISREDAREQGTKLVRLMQLIYKPITQGEFEETTALRRASGHLPKSLL